jgi:hypothetical protein
LKPQFLADAGGLNVGDVIAAVAMTRASTSVRLMRVMRGPLWEGSGAREENGGAELTCCQLSIAATAIAGNR